MELYQALLCNNTACLLLRSTQARFQGVDDCRLDLSVLEAEYKQLN
jgi:hypothetical protein